METATDYRLNAFYRLNAVHKWPDQECHHIGLISCASIPYGKRLLSLTWHPMWLLKEARSPQVPQWQKENSHIWISIIKTAWARAQGGSQALSPFITLGTELWQKQECNTSLQSAQSVLRILPPGWLDFPRFSTQKNYFCFPSLFRFSVRASMTLEKRAVAGHASCPETHN